MRKDELMKNILKMMFTTADNSTIDLGRILWAKMSIAFVGLSIWGYAYGHATFDPVSWSAGAAGVLAGGAGGLRIKQSTEPNGGQNAGTSDQPGR